MFGGPEVVVGTSIAPYDLALDMELAVRRRAPAPSDPSTAHY